MKIHIALVSAQILPNLIPILMERPDRVLLMVTSEMAARRLDRRLEKLLKEQGIGVELCLDVPDAGLREIKAYADTLADRLIEEQADAEIVLNATGGTKLMSLGFVEAFRQWLRDNDAPISPNLEPNHMPTHGSPILMESSANFVHKFS